MRNYREVELLAQKSLANSGTETIDINVDEPITEITVRLYAKNSTNPADEVPPETVCRKVEIVDGGQVYTSLDGRELTALACYEKKRWPTHWYTAQANEGGYVEWPISFGRYLGDEQFAFSPTRLLNPQIKVTWVNDALHTTTDSKLDINAKVMQGVSAPSQCLLTKVVKAWTGGASGVVAVDLPTDYPYRKLFFKAFLAETTFGNMITHAQLNCDLGKLIVFDMAATELQNLMERLFGQFEYTELPCISNGESIMTHLGYVQGGSLTAWATNCIVSAVMTNIPYCHVQITDNDGTGRTNQKVSFTPHGLCPELTYCYPFGRQDDPASWFNAPGYGSIKLNLTEGGHATVSSVFIQQPVPLP